jgi:hypothetical protein
MRKRIAIGAIAVIVIGVTGYLLSQPRKGTVEWHSREYRRACAGYGRYRLQHAMNAVRRRLGLVSHFQWRIADLRKEKEHQTALINLGFLKESTFVVSNHPSDTVSFAATLAIEWNSSFAGLTGEFVSITRPETNVIRIVAEPKDTPLVMSLIRECDVPVINWDWPKR